MLHGLRRPEGPKGFKVQEPRGFKDTIGPMGDLHPFAVSPRIHPTVGHMEMAKGLGHMERAKGFAGATPHHPLGPAPLGL